MNTAAIETPYLRACARDRRDAVAKFMKLRTERAVLDAELRLTRELGQRHHGLRARLQVRARAAHIARAFLLGKSYRSVEGISTLKPIPRPQVEAKVRQVLGAYIDLEELSTWLPSPEEEQELLKINARFARDKANVRSLRLAVRVRRTREEWEAVLAAEDRLVEQP